MRRFAGINRAQPDEFLLSVAIRSQERLPQSMQVPVHRRSWRTGTARCFPRARGGGRPVRPCCNSRAGQFLQVLGRRGLQRPVHKLNCCHGRATLPQRHETSASLKGDASHPGRSASGGNLMQAGGAPYCRARAARDNVRSRANSRGTSLLAVPRVHKRAPEHGDGP